MAELARQLMPTRVSILLRLAKYWDARGSLEKTLQVLGQAMTAKPSLARDFYPNLLQLAESADYRAAFKPFAESPPIWWDGFYAHVAKRALSLETLVFFTAMRRESEIALSELEREAAVERLLVEGEWAGAYLMWVNGLSESRKKYLGSVFNGGFEADITHKGFDWRAPKAESVKVEYAHSYGIQGERALHLNFKGREFHFRGFFHMLYLGPGDYQFVARVRPDRLQGRGGLSWVVRCAGAEETELGSSKRFIGSNEWVTEKFVFTVPEEACVAQVLSLESQGNRLFDHKLQGDIWFDRVGIRRTRPE